MPKKIVLPLQRHSLEGRLRVDEVKDEGTAIASLIGDDGSSVVGWVYRWTTGEHSVMWDGRGPQPVSKTRPDLNAEQKLEIDFDALTRIVSGDNS